MSIENDPQAHKPVPRFDSFEVIDVDCMPVLTAEEKRWPVVGLIPRVDSCEMVDAEPELNGVPPDVALRVTVATGATPDDLAVVLQRLRAAVEEARTATGGRVLIRLDTPSDAA